MNIYKTPFGTGFERYEKAKQVSASVNEELSEYTGGHTKEAGYFNYLRDKLRRLQTSGTDLHFGQINVDSLSDKAINFYRLFQKGSLDEKQLDEYTSQFPPGDNEYQFVALLRNWILERKSLDAANESNKKRSRGKIK